MVESDDYGRAYEPFASQSFETPSARSLAHFTQSQHFAWPLNPRL